MKRITSQRIVLLGLAGLVIVALGSGIAWLTISHPSPTVVPPTTPTAVTATAPTVVTPTAQAGVITEFPIPTVGSFLLPTGGSTPDGITAGRDGDLWFTERSDNKIGRISPTGTITEFPIPNSLPLLGTEASAAAED